jgi:tRNA(Ile)-lysidine synthase
MTTALHRQVLGAIERHRMIAPGERLGVAVSGGADSVALLRLLDDLRAPLGISLVVLHFHHGLRGAEADADQESVAKLARERGLEFLPEGEDAGAWARAHRRNLEDAARELRHAYFRRVVAGGRARRVAVAHTADDQAETVLAHLFRGSGLPGLAGIYPVVGDVVRPLLEVRRADLRAWLTSIGQSWREDSTNLDTRRLRARLRIELLPLLERDFQPQIAARLGNLGRIAREEEAFWSALVDERFHALVSSRATGSSATGIEIGVGDFLAPISSFQTALPADASLALSRRLLRRIVEALAGDNRGLTSSHVEQVLRLAVESSSGRRVTLPRGLVVEKSFDGLLFSARAAAGTESAPAPSYEYLVELPKRGDTKVTIPAIHRQVCLKVVDWPPAQSDTSSSAGALDADLLHPPFLLRNWQPGDVYRPRGRQRARKVKFLFRESRIAARDRHSWPVLTSQGRLVWVPGLPVAEEFAARGKTRVGLLISEEKI